jgi:hypothetical protein
MNTPAELPVLPWWRVKMVWLVIAGPAAVVLASLGTAVLAVRGADTVVLAPVAAQAPDAKALSEAPALQARNHTAAVSK